MRHPSTVSRGRFRATLLLAAACGLGAARDAAGAGFALFERSARGLGSAFAGEVAVAEDASTIAYNPAGLTLLHGTQLTSSLDAVIPSFHFHNEGSRLNPAVGGGPLRGNDGGNAGETGLVPTFYLSHALTDRWRLGLGLDAPFGLRTEYDRDWVGRYHAVVADLKTVNINPSVAYRALDALSVGVGMSVQYAHVKITNFLDIGSLCTVAQGLPPEVCAALGLKPQANDGFVKITGSDWSLGWNLGAMYHPTPHTHVGVAYRSRIAHAFEGDADFSVPKSARAIVKPTGQLRDTAANANVTFPDSASLGAFHEINPKWAVMGDVTWTHWELFRRLAVNFANPKQVDFAETVDWRDSFRYALGVRWQPRPNWSFRFGSAYDETAVRNAELRTARIPDSDRVWMSIGAGYRWSDRLRFDVGYAHIFVLDANIANRDAVTGHLLRGSYDGDANIFGGQVTMNPFD